MTPRLHTPANFLHLPEEVPEIFDTFFDAVVGLGVLVGEYLGQTGSEVALWDFQERLCFRSISL